MVALQMLRLLSVPVFGVVLFAAPARAGLEHQAGVPPIQGPQPERAHEGRPDGIGSMRTYRSGLAPDFHASRALNVKSVGEKVSGPHMPSISPWPSMNVKQGHIPAHDAGGAGIPMWRW
ncbi:MAG: hypothetical protein H8K08_12605 [Nitrospira sp.]|nr:hypothetical protein [Nitrospira sp.]